MAKAAHPGIILLGMPRSGTTLLRRILDAHPNICCPGESFLLRATSRFLESEEIAFGIEYGVLGGLGAIGYEQAEILARTRQMAFGYFEELARAANKPRWACKTAVDSFHIKGIERLYGEHAYFIGVARHGLDVACSLREFSDELQGYIAELHPYIRQHARPLEAFTHAWADVTRDVRGLVERHPDNAMLCRYEDLIADPTGTMTRLLDFVGETWRPDLLEGAFAPKEVVGLGDYKTYATKTINKDSIDRWHGLADDMVAKLAEIANPELEACGYPPVAAGKKLSSDDAMRLYELAMMFKSVKSA
ncbi:MAG: sulfotransferase family protein [Dongiaceae bacterium]